MRTVMSQALTAKSLRASLVAGLISGVVGLLVFLTIHHFWIKPIWFILPAGLLIAGPGGLAAGWAYDEVRVRLPPRPWASLAMFGLIAAILGPAIILSQILSPVVDIAAGKLTGSVGDLIGRFALLFVLSAAMGALTGRLLTRTWRGAAAMGIAGFVFALGPGHNIPFFGNTPLVYKELALLAAITLSSSVALVEADALIARIRLPSQT